MKKARPFILAAAVFAPLPSALVAQVIDSPGPGYRAQAELFSPKITPPDMQIIVGTPAVLQGPTNVDFKSVPKPPPLATPAPFSEPIRLFNAAPAAKRDLPTTEILK